MPNEYQPVIGVVMTITTILVFSIVVIKYWIKGGGNT